MRLLVDTNVLIEHLNDTPTWELLFHAFRREEISLSISVISRFEIFSYPKFSQGGEASAMLLLQTMRTYTIDERIADTAALLRRNFKRKPIDLLIAATALTNDLPIVTRDKDGFKGIQGLIVYTNDSFLRTAIQTSP